MQGFKGLADIHEWSMVLNCPLIDLVIVDDDAFLISPLLASIVDWRDNW